MIFKKIEIFIKQNKLISILILISLVSTLRTLLLPLSGDEITYSRIAENIMYSGEYSLDAKPSTITPSIPVIIAFFYSKTIPELGFFLAKLVNLLFLITGLRYLYLFLKETILTQNIIWIIILLTVVNSNMVIWGLKLYPETILFCFFWAFIYLINTTLKRSRDFILILISFLILLLTRYVFAVLGVMLLYSLYPYVKNLIQKKDFKVLRRLLVLSFICMFPILFWFKYVYNVEKEVDTGLSYFTRFQNNDMFYNLKAGLGIIQHEQVSKVNGIPAFITLFLPVTGFRSWILSLLLMIVFIWGYVSEIQLEPFKKLFIAILLIMGGLVFAGTGFSRYWLPMLPGFILGFYLFFKSLNIKDSHFILLSKMVAVVYVINEIRINHLIFSKIDYY